MNEVISAILNRRSTRSFTDEKVNKSDLQTIVNSAIWAPSAMNTQAWHFTVITNEQYLNRINSVVKDAVSDETTKRITQRGNGTFNFFYKAPALVIVSGDENGSPYITADCSCALQNMFLTAHSLNLGTCWINQLCSICDDEKVRALLGELGVPKQNKVYGCCAVGHIKTKTPPRERKSDTINFVE